MSVPFLSPSPFTVSSSDLAARGREVRTTMDARHYVRPSLPRRDKVPRALTTAEVETRHL